MADEQLVIREINVGRITGLSSYELAVKYGFIGTEEDFVAKEMNTYNKMVELLNASEGFTTIKYGDQTIKGSDGKTITLETDDYIDLVMDTDTNTLRIGLKEEIKNSLAYVKQNIEVDTTTINN